jgi:hypothetical protein
LCNPPVEVHEKGLVRPPVAARQTSAAAAMAEVAHMTRGLRRAIAPPRLTTAAVATAGAACISRDQRRLISPASRTTVAGDTGRVPPLPALLFTASGGNQGGSASQSRGDGKHSRASDSGSQPNALHR